MDQNSRKPLASTLIESTPWDSSWPESADRETLRPVLGYLESRFGLCPECFEDYVWFMQRRSWWIMRRSPFLNGAGLLKVSRVGMKAVVRVGRFLKPTTRFIQSFGSLATRAGAS